MGRDGDMGMGSDTNTSNINEVRGNKKSTSKESQGQKDAEEDMPTYNSRFVTRTSRRLTFFSSVRFVVRLRRR